MTKIQGHIKVASKTPGELPLQINFVNRKVFDDAHSALRKAGFEIVDEFFGFSVCSSGEEVVSLAKFWNHEVN